MRKPDERGELIRAVQRGEAATAAAARLGVPVSTAYRWLRTAAARALLAPTPTPTFVEVVAERAVHSAILVRVGAAELELRAGFDARLLLEVVEALRGES